MRTCSRIRSFKCSYSKAVVPFVITLWACCGISGMLRCVCLLSLVDVSDSEGEEYDTMTQPCSVLVLTGPCGVGKTTSVYSLANDIGFKVCSACL